MTIRSDSSLRHGNHKQHDHDHHGDLDHCDVDHHGPHDHNGEDPLEDHDTHGDAITLKTMITIAKATMKEIQELMERLHTGQL